MAEPGKTARDPLTDKDKVIGLAIEVHRELGPGLLESAYEECLCYELEKHNVAFQRQVPLPVIYKEVRLECGYRLDIVVEEKLTLELKTVEKLLRVHSAQLLTYLKLSGTKNWIADELQRGCTQGRNSAAGVMKFISVSLCLCVSVVNLFQWRGHTPHA